MTANGETLRTTIAGLRSIAGYIADLIAALEQVLPDYAPPPALTPYSQRDPLWRDYEYAHNYIPPATLGRYGCYITCVAMLASLAGYDDTPPQVAAKLTAARAFTGSQLDHPERVTAAYPRLKWIESVNWRAKPADLARLSRELTAGPVILEVEFKPGGATPPTDQHFVLAQGLTPDGCDLHIIDPWDGASTNLLERYALDNWNLARAIYGARIFKVGE